jgi:SAM-dependent methyltransferase
MTHANLQMCKKGMVNFEYYEDPKRSCPNCGGKGMTIFYAIDNIPVHSCLLMPSRSEAVGYATGDLKLGYCSACGFIANTRFDALRHEYSTRYEETQGFSPCFNSFARSLAQRLIDQYDIHNKNVLEIGCGKGEFLMMMCELGNNWGVGIDPSYVPGRLENQKNLPVQFIQDFYSEKYADLTADVICCRHTLEHIGPTGTFLRQLRNAIGSRTDTLIFFEVPDTVRVLKEGAFWDIYYEHCSYFTSSSLTRLFQASGFDILDVSLDYDDQYILLTAKPREEKLAFKSNLEDDLTLLPEQIIEFQEAAGNSIVQWHTTIGQIISGDGKVVVWGSGSKGVAFLTTLGLYREIEYVVDINPYRQGKFIPGTGQRIVAPAFLQEYRPDAVIVMNPIYCQEIQKDLDRMELKTQLLPVTGVVHGL